MSLNEGYWSLYHSPWSEGYKLGDVADADLERDFAVGREMRRGDRLVFDMRPWSARRQRIERKARRRVDQRQLVELGCIDLGGEA